MDKVHPPKAFFDEARARERYVRVLDDAENRFHIMLEEADAKAAVIQAQIERLRQEAAQLERRRSYFAGQLGAIVTDRERFARDGYTDMERVNFEAKLWMANAVAAGRVNFTPGEVNRKMWAMMVGARLDEECLRQMDDTNRDTFCARLEDQIRGIDERAVENMLGNAHHYGYLNLAPAVTDEVSVVQKVQSPPESSRRSRFEVVLAKLLQKIRRGEETIEYLSLDKLIEDADVPKIEKDAEGNQFFVDPREVFAAVQVGDTLFFEDGQNKEYFVVVETMHVNESPSRLLLRQDGTTDQFIWNKPNQIVKNGDGRMVGFLSPKMEAAQPDRKMTAVTFNAGAMRRLNFSRVGILAKKG